MGLNGKTYEMQYLTDEETAVINAMRMGAKVDVMFYKTESLEQLDERMDIFSEFEAERFYVHDLVNSRSVAFTKQMKTISLAVYVQADKQKNRP